MLPLDQSIFGERELKSAYKRDNLKTAQAMNIILVSKVAEDRHSYLISVETYGLSATEIELFQKNVFFSFCC